MTPMLSAEMLKVLQLVGFNFKKAIGEPLTLLVAKLITAQIPPDPQSTLEINRLSAESNVAMLQIAQDAEAFERLRHVVAIWRGNSEDV
jgi:hypothetical protein